MHDLQDRIGGCYCGRAMLAKVPDLLFEAMMELPDDIDPHDPYLRAILHQDILESIARRMDIPY